MTTWQLLTETWSWHPSVLAGCLALLVAYALACTRGVSAGRASGRWVLFSLGVLALLFSLVSPLDELGDSYLFSAHMLQHLIILQVTPLLLIVGLPLPLVERALQVPVFAWCERLLRRLPVAWLLSTVTLFAWHIPALYNAALADENVHIVEHLAFLVTAVIFWWPILTPREASQPGVFSALFYLFTAMGATAALGIFLTFVPPGLYPAYLNPPADAVTALLRGGWGLTAVADEQFGGLLMWVGGGGIYLIGLAVVLAHWFRKTEDEDLLVREAADRPALER
jgi:cytochrome c oxidase assembly factor CtaG